MEALMQYSIVCNLSIENATKENKIKGYNKWSKCPHMSIYALYLQSWKSFTENTEKHLLSIFIIVVKKKGWKRLLCCLLLFLCVFNFIKTTNLSLFKGKNVKIIIYFHIYSKKYFKLLRVHKHINALKQCQLE
jgi:hypothetical protein